jgi:DNA sulfur modification protein DndD
VTYDQIGNDPVQLTSKESVEFLAPFTNLRTEARLARRTPSTGSRPWRLVLAPQGIGVQVPSSAPIQKINKSREGQPETVGGVTEVFELSSDGVAVADVDSAHWQDFVQELIPIGVSDLFFFDGEKVQLLAEDESDKKTLSEAVRNLLGTDIIEKLSADLNIYRSRAVQRAAAEDESASELETLNTTAETLRARREIAGKDADSAGALTDAYISEVQTLEQQLQEQGGSYAKNRGRLEERKRQIAVRVSSRCSRRSFTGNVTIATSISLEMISSTS